MIAAAALRAALDLNGALAEDLLRQLPPSGLDDLYVACLKLATLANVVRRAGTEAGDAIDVEFGDPRVDERLWRKVAIADSGCWQWTAAVGRNGYPRISVSTSDIRQGHRVFYRLLVGPAPDGAIDHLCHNRDLTCSGGKSCRHRRCVNPAHLQAVSAGVNCVRSVNTVVGGNVRRSHCLHGHPFDEENTRVRAKGRMCRTCDRERAREKRAANRITPDALPDGVDGFAIHGRQP